MDTKQVWEEIRKEFVRADAARNAGNHGMVRVCARRAAGIALRFSKRWHSHGQLRTDALGLLHTVSQDQSMPPHVREAAERLLIKATQQSRVLSTPDPIEDSKTIIHTLFEEELE